MKSLFVFACLLLSVSWAKAVTYSTYEGTLIVEKPMEVAIKSKKVMLEKGSYQAKLETIYKGFFVIRDYINFEIQTDQGVLSGSMKFKKKSDVELEDQAFNAKQISNSVEKIVSDAITETRQCVKQSFTSQENCHIESKYECPGGFSTPNCSGNWVDEVVCDTVVHDIYGTQNVTFNKTIDTVTRAITFIDKADGSKVASLTVINDYNSEKVISQTPCQ